MLTHPGLLHSLAESLAGSLCGTGQGNSRALL